MRSASLVALLALTACEQSKPPVPAATQSETAPASQAAELVATGGPTPTSTATPTVPVNLDTFVALGTEPFWSATTAIGKVTYSTPENQTGETIAVTESTVGGVRSYSGKLAEKPFVLRIAKGECSDGMSDTVYTYTASLTVSGEDRRGCARRK